MSHLPLAVIDLGSNSSRVVVLRADAESTLEVLADEHVSLRLIRELDERRRLRSGAQERAVRVLQDFRHVAAAAGARRTLAVATAAIREAANGAAFLRRVRAETGLTVRVLDARTEARCAFLGAVYGLPVESGLMVDIGGGSLQIARFKHRALVRTWSLPLGALLLSDRFLTDDPPGGGEMRRLRKHVHQALARAGIPPRRGAETLVGTGGTIRNLAKIDAQRTHHPVPRLHGYELSRRHLQEVVGLVAGRRLEARGELAGLNPRRADSIVGGGLIAECVMDGLGADRLLVAGQGLREGLALAAGGLPMPTPPAVRARSIAALAARFSAWEESRATRRLALVRSLYRKLEPHASPELEEMLAHAALVLDVGRSVDYYRRHEQSAAILRVTGLLGFTHREILLLAAVIELAGDGRTSLKPGRPLLHGDDHEPLARAACVLALADFIEHRLPPARAPRVACTVKRKSVVLREPCLYAWRDEEFADRFQRAFGKELSTGGRRG
jgi:exopolyphosphatase/guanosine-5'-triphosphate,3'-diphosphate pyrophosphatase